MNKNNNYFLLISTTLILLLPLMTATYIFLVKSKLIIFSFFSLILLISFLLGVSDKQEKPKKILIMLSLGIILSLIQLFFLNKFGRNPIYLIAFPIYLWAWTAIYAAGLRIKPNNLHPNDMLDALITSLAGLGTLTWLWFNIFGI